MPRKSKPKPFRIGPLMRIVCEPVDDPAEIAAFERARIAHRRKLRRAKSRRVNSGG